MLDPATRRYGIALSPHFSSLICSASTMRSNVRSRAGPFPIDGDDDEWFRSSFWKVNEIFREIVLIDVWLTYSLSFWAPLSLFLHSFSLHSTVETFLVTTILTSVALLFIDDAILFLSTRVRQVLSHGSLEEAFAPFATEEENEKKM